MAPARKILFVTHDTSLYGASKSLQALIHSLREKVECHLVVRREFRRAVDLSAVKAQFGVEKVYTQWLPFLDCYVGRQATLSFKDRLWLGLSNFLAKFGRRNIAALAADYDLVHLNSLVLAPLVTDGTPYILHVRELWDGRHETLVRSRLEACAAVVFIDEPVRLPFQDFRLQRTLVVANPVLPPGQACLSADKSWVRDRIAGRLTLAIIGRVTEEKGIGFLLQCLSSLPEAPIALLVVGEGEMVKACEAYAAHDPRLIVYGVEPDMDAVYGLADVVIRAEDSPRIGRTVYEALYSGRAVALPGTQADYPAELVMAHRKQIHFYDARNVASFTALIEVFLQQPPERVAPILTAYDTTPLLQLWNDCVRTR